MLNVELDEVTAIATLIPEGALSKSDFAAAAEVIDSYIDSHEKLNGIMIYARHFPGWDSFASALKHFTFVKEHHKKIAKVALVSDMALGEMAEKIVNYFVYAEVKHFAFDDLREARSWILNN